jgi:ABC-2 type transport system permease protein
VNALIGTGSLVRLALRRDRIVLPVWILGLIAMTIPVAASIGDLYPTVQARQQLSLAVGTNPSLIAMTGPAFNLTEVGGIVAWRVGGFATVLAALMSAFTVVRHTRAEEESGRLELLGSTVVGRFATLTASLIVAFAANLVLATVVALGLIGQGLPAAGSVAFGLALGLTGCAFAAVAAVAAQLTEGARAANSLAGGLLGAVFVLRAVGDSAGDDRVSWLSWLSPIGWAQQTRAFADERWWVLGLPSVAAVVLVSVAFVLITRRDIGAGLLPTRLGPSAAPAGLRGPFSLAWRLQRGAMLGWVGGFAVVGAAYGAVAQGLEGLLGSTPQMKQVLTALGGEKALIDAYFSTTLSLLGVVASAYAVAATLRLRGEETALRAEPILATRTRRVQWAGSHLVMALLGTTAVLGVAGLVEGLVHGLSVGDVGGQLPRVLAGALVQVPATWVVAGIAVALFGLVPSAVTVSWAAVLAFVLVGQFGPMLQLPQWLMDLSPFTHVPKVPGADVSVWPIAALIGVAIVLAVAGLAGFRRRDIG